MTPSRRPERAARPPVEVLSHAFGSSTDHADPAEGWPAVKAPSRARPIVPSSDPLMDLDGGNGFVREQGRRCRSDRPGRCRTDRPTSPGEGGRY